MNSNQQDQSSEAEPALLRQARELPFSADAKPTDRDKLIGAAAVTCLRARKIKAPTPNSKNIGQLIEKVVSAECPMDEFLRTAAIELVFRDHAGLFAWPRIFNSNTRALKQRLLASEEDILTVDGMSREIDRFCRATAPDPAHPRLCHFNGKITNSNAGGFVYVSPERKSNLPYLFTPSIQNDIPVPPDLMGNGANTIIKIMQDPTVRDKYTDEQVEYVEKLRSQHPTGDFGMESIDPRMRQIVLPSTDVGYVNLIPMGSAGVAAYIIDQYYSMEQKARLNAGRAANQIGGANVQNVSSHIQISTSLIFPPPMNSSRSAQTAYRIYYRGFNPVIPRDLLNTYARNIGSGGHYKTDRVTGKSIEIHLKSGLAPIIHDVFRQLKRAMEACVEHKHALDKLDDGNGFKGHKALDRAIIEGYVPQEHANNMAARIVKTLERMTVGASSNHIPINDVTTEIIERSVEMIGERKLKWGAA